jgi:hypothetical protein
MTPAWRAARAAGRPRAAQTSLGGWRQQDLRTAIEIGAAGFQDIDRAVERMRDDVAHGDVDLPRGRVGGLDGAGRAPGRYDCGDGA